MDPQESGIETGAADPSQSEPSQDTSGSQEGTSAVDPSQQGAEPSYQNQGDQSPQYVDQELERLAGGILPQLQGPITSPAVLDKLKRDIGSIIGRYNSSKERVKAYEDDLKGRAKSYSELAQAPGMKELMYGWANQNAEMFQKGIQILADSMGPNGVSPAAPGAHPGNGAPQMDPNAQWWKLKPEQVGDWVDARINRSLEAALDAKLRQHVGPIYSELSKYQREQQFGALQKVNPDLEKYRPLAERMLANVPGLTEEQAYVLAKHAGGGFRQTQGRPAGMVSEGAGQSNPLEQIDPGEAIVQGMFGALNQRRRP